MEVRLSIRANHTSLSDVGARSSLDAAFAAVLFSLVVVSLAPAPRARAGGIELTAAGAKPLGRGGAIMSSAEETNALRYNPARLGLGRRWSVGTDVQVHLSKLCFARESAPSTGPAFPEVCNQGGPGVIPQLNGQWRLGKRFGLGLGFLPPPGAAASEFGNEKDGTFVSEGKSVPSPARYTLVKGDNTAFFSTLGAGGGTEKLRVGLSFGWGVFILSNVAFAAGLPGDSARFDVRSGLSGVDAFVPRGTLGFDIGPFAGLSFSSVTTVTQDVHAKGALFLSGVTSGMAYSDKIPGVVINQPLGWESGLGARYTKSRWDLELNVVYLVNSHVRNVVIDIPKDARIEGLSGQLNGKSIAELQDRQTIARHWQNQWLFRLGGECAVIMERLMLRAGLSRESAGVEHGYESVNNFNVARTGLHLGVGLHLTRRLEVNLAYAAILHPLIRVLPDEARLEQGAAARPGKLADDVVYLNAGTYRSSHQVVALSMVFRAAQDEPQKRPATDSMRGPYDGSSWATSSWQSR